MTEIVKDQYLNDIECDERPVGEDYRTEKEKRADLGDYLKDRDYDRKMSGGFDDRTGKTIG